MKTALVVALAVVVLLLANDKPRAQHNGGCYEDAVRTWAGECIALDDLEVPVSESP